MLLYLKLVVMPEPSILQAIFSPTGSSAGIGFAIPVDTLRYEVNSIVKDGKVVRPVLGISYLDSSQAKALGIRDGILVLGVPENSPAQLAGIKATTRGLRGNVELGDIIVGIDSDNVSSEADLLSAIEKHQVGDIVTVKLRRMVSSPDVVSSDQTIPLEVKIKLASRDAL